MKATTRSIGIILSALACLSATVWAGDEKLASELRRNGLQGNIDVIVRYKTGPAEAHYRKVVNAGGVLKHRFDLIHSGHYSVPSAMLKDLANDAEVEFVSPDRPVRGMLDLTGDAVNAAAAANLQPGWLRDRHRHRGQRRYQNLRLQNREGQRYESCLQRGFHRRK